MEERVEYNRSLRNSYIPCGLKHEDDHDNLHPGIIKLEQWMLNKG